MDWTGVRLVLAPSSLCYPNSPVYRSWRSFLIGSDISFLLSFFFLLSSPFQEIVPCTLSRTLAVGCARGPKQRVQVGLESHAFSHEQPKKSGPGGGTPPFRDVRAHYNGAISRSGPRWGHLWTLHDSVMLLGCSASGHPNINLIRITTL